MSYKILVKFPTRGRWDKFLKLFELYNQTANDLVNTHFVITTDIDDNTKPVNLLERLKPFKNFTMVSGLSTGKINACNRDMEMFDEWDIVVLASDDMIPQVRGWDDEIRKQMDAHFPDTDGVLWFNDGYTKQKLNTMCIIGKKYYDRFGYIYHPDYISLWCDNEMTEVSQILNKVVYSDKVLFKHEHPANNGQGNDKLYQVNEKFYNIDRDTYLKRKKINFGL